jgi:Ca2+-binding RTX toxin-like protein
MSTIKITDAMVTDGVPTAYGADTVSFENVTVPIVFGYERSDNVFLFAPPGTSDPALNGDSFVANTLVLTNGDDVFGNVEDQSAQAIYGGGGNDIIATSAYRGGERLEGGTGNDILYGNSAGRETLLGGSGSDELHVHGADKATGGAGADKFIFEATDYLGGNSFLGSAFICDLQTTGPDRDVIDISGPLNRAGYHYASFTEAQAAGTVGVSYLHGYTYLSFDSNADHVPDQEFAHIKGVILPDILDQTILVAPETDLLV